jgi:hypothetical protein
LGAPLVAREFETGTSQFAWMQSITRRRWLMVKTGWQFIIYQPASRYWAFQGIETGIVVFLAAVLLAVTAIVVLRRDA